MTVHHGERKSANISILTVFDDCLGIKTEIFGKSFKCVDEKQKEILKVMYCFLYSKHGMLL